MSKRRWCGCRASGTPPSGSPSFFSPRWPSPEARDICTPRRMDRRAALPFLAACVIAAAAPLVPAPQAPAAAAGFPGWPAEFEGRPLRPLPLTALEERFADNFPGRVGRFSDGDREIILRWVAHETRRVHPAADCFKASGYELTPKPI